MSTGELARMERALWPRGERRDIWMILDAAREREIYSIYLDFTGEKECLYAGPLAPALRLAAPYLLRLEFEDMRTRRLLSKALGRNWGIFLKCDHNLKTIRKHFRQFLLVRDAQGRRLAFRYYDPRVLRIFLPTCTPGELRQLFGPIECFWAENHGDELVEFTFAANALLTRIIGLS